MKQNKLIGKFQAPKDVARVAAKGLVLRGQHKGRGGTSIGVARARDLKNRKPISMKTIKRMASYFARHEVDKRAKNFGDNNNPSNGYIAWLLWGGDVGKKWVAEIIRHSKNFYDQKV